MLRRTITTHVLTIFLFSISFVAVSCRKPEAGRLFGRPQRRIEFPQQEHITRGAARFRSVGRFRWATGQLLHTGRSSGWRWICGFTSESREIYGLSWLFGASHLAKHLFGELFRSIRPECATIAHPQGAESIEQPVHRTAVFLSFTVWHAFEHQYPFVFELFAVRVEQLHVVAQWRMGTECRWVCATVQHRIDKWRRTELAEEFVFCLFAGAAGTGQGCAIAEKWTVFHWEWGRRRDGADSRQWYPQHYRVSYKLEIAIKSRK